MQDYANFIKEVESLERISIQDAQEQTLKLFKSNIDDDWGVDTRLQAYTILDMVCKYKQNGDADDFHNYAVTFSRINDYDAACIILKCGLNRFPRNVDLLADYLIYGPDCSSENRFQECDDYLKTLNSIDVRLWTWRAFDFSIQYLMTKMDQGVEDVEFYLQEIDLLSQKYLKAYPLDERAYFTTYLMQHKLKHFRSNEQPEKILEQAVSLQINTPRCSLKLAEIMFDKKEYDRALLLLDKTIQDSIERNSGLSLANVYLLRFTIKAVNLINILDSCKTFEATDEMISKIKNAYLDYRVAKKLGNDSQKTNSAYQYVKIIETSTGILMDESTDEFF